MAAILFKQVTRFLFIGVGSTATHLSAFAALMEWTTTPPLVANTLAFVLAVGVSFSGHFLWTFRENTRHKQFVSATKEMFKFAITALFGLALNSIIVWTMISVMAWDYVYTLIPMGVGVPMVVFVITRFWVFPEPKPAISDSQKAL